jgi:indole-3-glycerol phosphate synthase
MTILDKILEVKKEEIKTLKQNFTLSRFSDSEYFKKPRFSFLTALNRNDRISIIAEIKKSSPSKGIICDKFNHMEIADIYIKNEVEAISILTDLNFFQGSISYLGDIASIKNVPLLRKDFIIDEYQIYEAKSNGADVVLLISEALSQNQIKELTAAALENDLEVLMELHSIDQVQKIDFGLNEVIGINNRNLENFKVDLETTNIISELIPEKNFIVSESGIKTKEDIQSIKNSRAGAVLVGEHLMSSNNINKAVEEFKEWCKLES